MVRYRMKRSNFKYYVVISNVLLIRKFKCFLPRQILKKPFNFIEETNVTKNYQMFYFFLLICNAIPKLDEDVFVVNHW